MPLEQRAAPPGRRDARRNRRLLVEAAGEIVRRDGPGASLDAIARRAGVGNATLYRHFPTRQSLLETVFLEAIARWDPIRERILAIADPWTALASYVEQSCNFIAADRALLELCSQELLTSPPMVQFSEREDRDLADLVTRTQRDGAVRADIDAADLRLLMTCLHQVVWAVMPVSPHAWRRHLCLTLDSLRPCPGPDLPTGSLTLEQLRQVFHHLTPDAHPARSDVAPPADPDSPQS